MACMQIEYKIVEFNLPKFPFRKTNLVIKEEHEIWKLKKKTHICISIRK